ncbi:MAG: PAS domain S-box protein [Anaerolinea sp.]|nr:PAS domain S-box protein [Anaerolinea sp.]
MPNFRIQRSLPLQIALNFVLIILMTAVIIGVPAVWLLRDQLERQAGALLAQGSAATEAFYHSRQREAVNLALLTAQRPTLRQLVSQGDLAALPPYLATLQSGADLDLLLVCDLDGRPLAQAGLPVGANFCQAASGAAYVVDRAAAPPQAWLLAAARITADAAQVGQVVVGWQLNDAFLQEMSRQSGLEQLLWLNETLLAASLPITAVDLQPTLPPPGATGPNYQFSLKQQPYYARHFLLNEHGLATAVALNTTDLVNSQKRLVFGMIGGIFLVTLLGSGLALFLAWRIGRPLDDLAAAAGALSWRALDKPVQIQSKIIEVSQVAQALEFARLELRHTLANLQQEKAWANHLLDSIVEGIMTLDGDGRVTFFSRGAEQITGWPRSETIGRAGDELFQMVETSAPFSQFIPASGQRERLTVVMANGRRAILAMTGAQLAPPAAGNAEVALVFRDVSEEEALHRLLGHFLANVAHEFRTPLSALAASIELLQDQAPDLTPAELEELLNALHLGIVGLQTLVDNLLESASIESGRFRVFLRPTNLNAIIGEAAQTMTPLIHKHGQRLRLDLPDNLPGVQADDRRLLQAIINLLSNAIKHGPDDAEIILSATMSPHGVKIAVADAGPGVPPQHRADLFHWFTRRNPQQERPPFGIGLGLAVVKAVALAHNGYAGIEDRPGGGSIFWIELPYTQ